MKPITCCVVGTIAMALAFPVYAQIDCTDWNTEAFFEVAEVSDVTRCLQAGADANARAGGDITSLHLAALLGPAESVAALAAAGADLEARVENNGFTPLHMAYNAEAIEALLQVDADPKELTSDGELPFDLLKDDEQLKKTNAYWKLYQARFSDKAGQ